MFRSFLPALLALASSAPLHAAPTITVTPSIAPNAFGSPNWNGYVSNASSALQAGATSFGTSGTPSYYQAVGGTVPLSSILATDFPSWHGQANPTGAFAGEVGNRLHFGLKIEASNGETFKLSQLSFVMDGSGSVGDALDFSVPAGSYTYDDGFLGFNSSGDQVFDPDADITRLYYRGTGNAFEVLSADPGLSGQDKINNFLNSVNGTFTITGNYFLPNASGSATVQVAPIPEPGTMAALLTGLVGLAAFRRRQKQQQVEVN